MGLDLSHGGSHGSPVNASGFVTPYRTKCAEEDGRVDYDEMEKKKHWPKKPK